LAITNYQRSVLITVTDKQTITNGNGNDNGNPATIVNQLALATLFGLGSFAFLKVTKKKHI